MVKGIKHFTLFSEHFRSNFSFDTFSKFEITPLQYFNGDPPLFSYQDKDNTHINFIFEFFKISRVHFFLKSRFGAINSIFLYIFHTIMAILDTYFEIATISLQLRWGMDFCTYIRNTMHITYAKTKMKFTEPIFQTATSSCLLNTYYSMSHSTLKHTIPYKYYHMSHTIQRNQQHYKSN